MTPSPKYQLNARVKKYGLTVEQYHALLAAQDGKCAACKQPFVKSPHIDHDHTTGRVRGLLCHGCNTALGALGDSISRAQALIEYLSADKEVTNGLDE